jgi:hypothetical protein
LFRPNCEIHQIGKSVQTTAIEQQIETIFAPLMMFLCKKDDVVVAKALPTKQLISLQQGGVIIPQFVEDISFLKGRKIGQYRPWGWSGTIATEVNCDWDITKGKLYRKSWGASRLKDYLLKFKDEDICDCHTVGKVCATIEECELHIKGIHKNGYSRAIIKAEFGTAGRSTIRCRYPLSKQQSKWLGRVLRQQGAVVVEPELQRVIDYSIQISVGESIKVHTVGRFETNAKGQYQGHWLGPLHSGLDAELLRFIHKTPKRWRQLINQTATIVGEELQRQGYNGPAGIDAMIYTEKGKFKIRPIVEVNPRYTMGRVAFELSKHVFPRSKGYFGISSTKKVSQREMVYRNKQFYNGCILLTADEYPYVAFLSVEEG